LTSLPLWLGPAEEQLHLEEFLNHSSSAPAALAAAHSLDLNRLASIEMLKATSTKLQQQQEAAAAGVAVAAAASACGDSRRRPPRCCSCCSAAA